MDFGRANLALEAARMLVMVLFPGRGVRQPATWTAKIFGRPDTVCHLQIMRHAERLRQRGRFSR